MSSTLKNLEVFANEGLRTLLLAERTVTNEEFQTWLAKYQEATTSLVDREKKIEDVQDQIEQGLKLVGATAIEDKLQDEVGETIGFIKDAGIKVWVLTGDKVETAINIAFSCNLITNAYNQIIIDGSDIDKVERGIQNAKLKVHFGIFQFNKFLVRSKLIQRTLSLSQAMLSFMQWIKLYLQKYFLCF